MSWIRKLFHMFKNDDEEDETIEEYVKEHGYEKSKPVKNPKESSRDVDARVVYQYPKGPFRFPVIPDGEGESERESRRPRPQEMKQREAPVKKLENRKQRMAEREEQKRAAIPLGKPEKVLTRNEREAANKKRPFQPTEIPSPIFGFERPKTSASKTVSIKEPAKYKSKELTYDEVMRKIQQAHPQKPKNTQASERIEKSDDTIFNKMEVFHAQAAALETVEYSEQTFTLSNDSDLMFEILEEQDHTEHNMGRNHSAETETRDAGSSNEKTGESKILEPETIKDHHLNAEKFEEAELEIKTIEEAQLEPELGEEPIQQQSKKIEKTDPEPSEIKQEQPVSLQVNELEQAELNREKDLPGASKMAAKEDTPKHGAENRQEQKPAARGHIPFNVIMLNNDRKKLHRQKELAKQTVFQNRPAKEQPQTSNITKRSVENVQQSAEAGEQDSENDQDFSETIEQAVKPPHQPFEYQRQAAEAQSNEDKQPSAQGEDEISYYVFPAQSLLAPPVAQVETSEWLYEQEQVLNSTLKNFSVRARVVNVTQGPSVTRFEVQPEPGVKVNKITNLSDDIKLSLAARDIRIEAPIPGKHTIGIEVPNQSSRPVLLSEIINTHEFQHSESPLTAVLGLDISGNPVVTDLRKMPHGLIAGATGSGKSVCINTILVSLLYKASPDELKMLLIDPKMVELAPYNRIPHLVSPVITDVKAATAALKWAVEEMERRYELFAHAGARDINRFNELADEHKRYSERLPFMVIVIDELADLMMMSLADVEEAICRIAQKARACGIHLIIATQRPSVDVITGLIKANVPTRIAFSVSSQIDSRTIIDISGAEKLLGRGDMLFLENGSSKPVRLQGTFVSDKEIDDVVAHVRKERTPDYLFEQEELLKKAQVVEEEDELFYEACEFVVDQGGASTSSLQRRFKIGYNRAARLIEMMEHQGFISENRGSKPRDVLITEADLESIQDTSTIN